VFVLDWGDAAKVVLPGLKQKIVSYSTLSGDMLRCEQGRDRIELSSPQETGNRVPSVAELVLDAPALPVRIDCS
jgi:hypothetical protein